MTQPLRVLVVDDNAINLRLATKLLQLLGHTGALAPDGERALRALAARTFDLVLLDVNMPVMDGPTTLQAIRERERQGAAKVNVIMVTAHDSPSDRRMLLAAGADGYIAKPLDEAKLQAEITRVLAASGR